MEPELLASHPGYLNLGERVPSTHTLRGWAWLRAGVDAVKKRKIVGFDVFTAMTMKNAVFLDMAPCSLPPPAHCGSLLADISTLKIEVIRSTETSIHTRSTRRHIPEDDIFQEKKVYPYRKSNPYSPDVQLVSHRCTDWTIAAPGMAMHILKCKPRGRGGKTEIEDVWNDSRDVSVSWWVDLS
jgi:hypothetical protein